MKNDRRALILEIIAQECIDTQELLQRRLAERGVNCTQATISRDIKNLHLVKEPIGQGRYRYAASSQQGRLNMEDKLRNIFHECVVSVDFAENIVVIKTMSGLANGAAAALDAMEIPGVVGSLAGNDTTFLAMRDRNAAECFCNEILDIIK